MKILLYSEMLNKIDKSGLGKAIRHQQRALDKQGIEHTVDIRDSYDIVHINTYFPGSFLLAHECKLRKKPLVYHAHSTMEDFRKSFKGSDKLAPLFKAWISTCYKLGDAVITPTPYAKSILENYGIDAPIYPISNGIDLDIFRAIPKAREIFCQEYCFKKDDFIVMGIGLYIERKGILDFLKLAKIFPKYKFVWFGYTDRYLIPKRIQNALENHPDNVILPGYVDNDKIRLALQAVDVFIMPTLEETEGIPALEACASKTPMIIRDIPAFDGWLEDGVNVYKAKNIDDFAYLLKQMEEGSLLDLTDEAYKLAKERDLGRVGLALKEVYESLLNKS